jgi:hypothetical protein
MLLAKDTFVKRIFPFIKYQSPAILWGLFICLLLFLPGGQLRPYLFLGFIPQDKIVHFVLFSFFALFNRVGWAKWYRCDYVPKRATRFTFFGSLLFAFFTELLQHFAALDRMFSLGDIVADSLGALFGLFVFQLLYKW